MINQNRIAAGNDTDSAKLIVVTDVYVHPNFNTSSMAHDLAIVETHQEIVFSSKVGAACLPFKYSDKDFVGETVEALGKRSYP